MTIPGTSALAADVSITVKVRGAVAVTIVVGSIASLNVALIVLLTHIPFAPTSGLVESTVGASVSAAKAVWNVQTKLLAAGKRAILPAS